MANVFCEQDHVAFPSLMMIIKTKTKTKEQTVSVQGNQFLNQRNTGVYIYMVKPGNRSGSSFTCSNMPA